ncbi:LRR receptor-like kinase family protein [Medicago truncatula]|uniref:non-specific serine/threonine protein kinase n=1 Tax=Medicago truncatula TaxID=3880 RepID=A0A072VHU4_MEDTR|nr:LRR receptor-like kinase family protein [Medicago truncatula]
MVINFMEQFLPLSEIGNLTKVSALSLLSNDLTGNIPTEMNRLNKLKILQFGDNNFIGHLPPNICSSGKLTVFSARNTQFTGPIPKSLKNCSSLKRVRLEQNQLAGNITDSFGVCPNLYYMELSGNKYFGHISPNWGKRKNLISLKISNNNLTGSIPLELVGATNLHLLDLSSNQLTGEIPMELGNLSSLIQQLSISSNYFSGEVPVQIASLKEVAILELATNNLSGFVPKQLGRLSMLLHLNMSQNKFEGNIPDEIGQLKVIENLDLSGNSLNGTIPTMLGQLNRLETLNLFCTIPLTYGEMSGLTTVDISCNQLKGPIPKISSFLQAPFEALRNNKGLCGNVSGLEHCSTSGGNFHSLIILTQFWCMRISSKPLKILTARSISLGLEYMEVITKQSCLLGSMDNILKDNEQASEFDWNRRVNVIKDIANALCYLHHDCSPPIVHRDISSKNVILDLEYVAHVSDFGTSKFLNPNSSNMTSFAGAPLDMLHQHPGDIVTYLWQQPSQSATDLTIDTIPLMDMLDQRLPRPTNDIIVHKVASMIRIAVACLTESPRSRPTMEQVCKQFVMS